MTTEISRRQRLRQATIEEIKDTARRQIAEDGAAHLSLGAIARAMGLTTPALYRYFENRDALVMALIADAYDSMAEALEAAVQARPAGEHRGRFLTMMDTYRQWALAHREEYALMFGAPVYGGPAGGTTPVSESIVHAMARSLRIMVEVFWAAHNGGVLSMPQAYCDPPPSVQYALRGLRIALSDERVPADVLALSFTTWLQAHGLIWQELHGVLPESLFGTGELYQMEMGLLAERLGLG
jgi:AcrR family transcriptional regulator